MSKLTTGIFGAIAVSLTFGAVQFALGRDLSDAVSSVSDAQATGINRIAKADRAGGAARSLPQTQTISLDLQGISATSVLIRMPLAQAIGGATSTRLLQNKGKAERTVACEPVVSVLTEIAKQLPPGRCVT